MVEADDVHWWLKTSSVHVLMQVADCRLNMGESREAAELYEHSGSLSSSSCIGSCLLIIFTIYFYICICIAVIKVDPTNNEAKKRLAEIYEAGGQLRRALDLLYQGGGFSLVLWVCEWLRSFPFLPSSSHRLEEATR